MKKWQIVILVLLCIVMLGSLAIGIIGEFVPLGYPDETQPTTSQESTEPHETEPQGTEVAPSETTHCMKVTVAFEEGKMVANIAINCECGEVTTFTQTCATKELALGAVENIKCEAFFVGEGSISREALVAMINVYEFAN